MMNTGTPCITSTVNLSHGRVTASYLGSSSSGSPSAPWSGYTQQERPRPAAGRPAGAQQLRKWAGTGFPGRKPCCETGKESAAWFSHSYRAHLCSLPGCPQLLRTWEKLEVARAEAVLCRDSPEFMPWEHMVNTAFLVQDFRHHFVSQPPRKEKSLLGCLWKKQAPWLTGCAQ